MHSTLIAASTILLLSFAQNVAFSIVSRSRNRDNMTYHIIAASASNVVWFMTFRELLVYEMSLVLLPSYIVGTVTGSVLGVKIAMKVEKWLGATSDGHLK